MVNAILVRHGARNSGSGNSQQDRSEPLTDAGEKEMQLLATMLAGRGTKPKLYITSEYEHALKSTHFLADTDTLKADIVPIRSFTPQPGNDAAPWRFQNIIEEVINEH